MRNISDTLDSEPVITNTIRIICTTVHLWYDNVFHVDVIFSKIKR